MGKLSSDANFLSCLISASVKALASFFGLISPIILDLCTKETVCPLERRLTSREDLFRKLVVVMYSIHLNYTFKCIVRQVFVNRETAGVSGSSTELILTLSYLNLELDAQNST